MLALNLFFMQGRESVENAGGTTNAPLVLLERGAYLFFIFGGA